MLNKFNIAITSIVTLKILFFLTFVSCTTANQNNPTYSTMEANTPSTKVTKTEEEWKQELTPMQYYVLRQKGTERPFTGAYWNKKDVGQYLCAGCKTLLFTSKTKYDSGCGWPSFYEAHNNDQILMKADYSHGMSRVEVLCATCEGHLGHVFEDGPPPTGVRYCINSESMIFIPAEDDK
jgi:peptide-methionine (R)-S-oxide reductase